MFVRPCMLANYGSPQPLTENTWVKVKVYNFGSYEFSPHLHKAGTCPLEKCCSIVVKNVSCKAPLLSSKPLHSVGKCTDGFAHLQWRNLNTHLVKLLQRLLEECT